jgi:hypothetical protein
MQTILNILDSEGNIIQRRLTEDDVIEEMGVSVGDWMTVEGCLYQVYCIQYGSVYKNLGEVKQIFFHFPPN